MPGTVSLPVEMPHGATTACDSGYLPARGDGGATGHIELLLPGMAPAAQTRRAGGAVVRVAISPPVNRGSSGADTLRGRTAAPGQPSWVLGTLGSQSSPSVLQCCSTEMSAPRNHRPVAKWTLSALIVFVCSRLPPLPGERISFSHVTTINTCTVFTVVLTLVWLLSFLAGTDPHCLFSVHPAALESNCDTETCQGDAISCAFVFQPQLPRFGLK